MVITPTDGQPISFTQFDDFNTNIAFETADLQAVYQFIESGHLARINMSNFGAALRAVFGAVIESFQLRQDLEDELIKLEEQLENNPDLPQCEVEKIQVKIERIKNKIANIKNFPDESVHIANKIRNEIHSNNSDYGNEKSQYTLIERFISLPSDADDKKQEKEKREHIDYVKNFNYEIYKEIVYDLTRDLLASRELENEENLELTPHQVGFIFYQFGLDPIEFDISARDSLAREILEPLTESVGIRVLQQEIRILQEVQISLANRRTLPQSAPLSLGQVQPLALAFGEPPARAGDLPPERPREGGRDGFSVSEDALDLPLELEKSEGRGLLSLTSSPLAPPQRSLEALIEIKRAYYNDLKTKIESRVGLELSSLEDGGPKEHRAIPPTEADLSATDPDSASKTDDDRGDMDYDEPRVIFRV